MGAVVMWTVILSVLFHGPSYTPAEQLFLQQVKSSSPGPPDSSTPWASWPSDSELVRQGHEICDSLTAHDGNWDVVVNPSWGGPSFMETYPSWDQRGELIDDAAKNFCSRYSIHLGHQVV
jgi:hypothetical protein